MTATAEQGTTVQVYRVYIRATQEKVWDAITDPEWTQRYGYGGRAEYDLRAGGAYRHFPSDDMMEASATQGFDVPDVIADGEVMEAEAPHRLVLSWRMLMDPDAASEGFTHLTYEIEGMDGGVTKLTVSHDLDSAPKLPLIVGGAMEQEGAGGGWSWILSDLKSLLETGSTLAG